MIPSYPFLLSGPVIKGFGRGSKQLGIPTANYPDEIVEKLPSELNSGIYFGWAQVDCSPVYCMVTSIGWNPYYKNTKKSVETHILHEFDSDFYGSNLKICIVDYIRPEMDFNSVDELIDMIKNDISTAKERLTQPQYEKYRTHPFFSHEKNGCESNGEHS
ncbi:riboflavin kinase [Nilaparvata lugens]|uniref:riboflavin kinase n=1 Tax=Nilaparvata lugens TaxID=108931 RepID=UPI00193D6EA5|nr:riboflavin kinase [Nilaparvata lugens]